MGLGALGGEHEQHVAVWFGMHVFQAVSFLFFSSFAWAMSRRSHSLCFLFLAVCLSFLLVRLFAVASCLI